MSKAGTKVITMQDKPEEKEVKKDNDDEKAKQSKSDEEEKKDTKVEVSQTLEACLPMAVKNGQKVVFGQSTRVYEIKIDYSKMQKAVEMEKKELEREIRRLERLDQAHASNDMDALKSTLGLVKQDTIYVSNLPYSCTEKDLSELFNDCGKIVSVRIPENKQMRGQNRGFAFITMIDERGARKALNYDGHKFYDRKLRVSQAEKKVEPIIENRVVEKRQEPTRRERSRSPQRRGR